MNPQIPDKRRDVLQKRIWQMRIEKEMQFKDIAAELNIPLAVVSGAFYNYERKLNGGLNRKDVQDREKQAQDREKIGEQIYEMRKEKKMPFKNIADELSMPLKLVHYMFYSYERKLNGGRDKRKQARSELDKKIKAQRENGTAIIRIANDLHVSAGTVRRRILAMGLGQRTIRYTDPKHEQMRSAIVAMYTVDGISAREIAESLKVSRPFVSKTLTSKGIRWSNRSNVWRKADDIVKMYVNENKSIRQIAADLGSSHETIRTILKSQKVRLRSRGPL